MGVLTWLKKVCISILINARKKVLAGQRKRVPLVVKPIKKCKKVSQKAKKTKQKRKVNDMPKGKGTYGSKVGRPPKKDKMKKGKKKGKKK